MHLLYNVFRLFATPKSGKIAKIEKMWYDTRKEEGNTMILVSFGAVHLGYLAFLVLVLVGVSLLARKWSEKTKKQFFLVLSAINIVLFAVYKGMLAFDTAYHALLLEAGRPPFHWVTELPFQLCNINMLLMPIALLWNKRSLLGFCFFAAPLGALMALCLPSLGFSGYSFFLPRMLGFFLTHGILFLMGLWLGTMGLFRPTWKDILPTLGVLLVLSLSIFLLNLLLRYTGIAPGANFFYLMHHDDNVLLKLFWSWIPVPYLYLLPALAILLPYMALMILLFQPRKQPTA